MGQYLNPNNNVFKKITSSKKYVDKTGLISYLNQRMEDLNPFIASIRPRRFGKSMAAQMLNAYYSKGCDSKELFQRLEIAGDPSFETHLNKYDVIFLDIQEMRTAVYNINDHKKSSQKLQYLAYINQEILTELKEAYPDCFDKDITTISEALININLKKGIQFIILIDEWDCFFREDKNDTKLITDYIQFLRSLFKGKKADNFIALAYITGILPIKKYGTQSALNNFSELTMVNPGMIGEYIGFTEDEVKDLCKENRLPFSQMEKWYDGYQFIETEWIGEEAVHTIHPVYCPDSVMDAIQNRNFKNYWSETETYESLKMYIEMNFDGLKDKVIHMLAGERCPIKMNTFQNDMTTLNSADDVLTLLIHLGYLAYDSETAEAFIPNLEVRDSFESSIEDGKFSETAKAIEESLRLLEATIEKDEETVAQMIEAVHDTNISALAYNSEQSLTAVILLAYYKARDEYTLVREYPAGKGFADIVFVPKKNVNKPAIIVELKWNQNVDTAIKQIKEKNYPASLKDYQDNLLLVGISYNKETKKHVCKIEECRL